nr:preprotein translocase subunit YajC [Curvibacter sp. CHRR-16]
MPTFYAVGKCFILVVEFFVFISTAYAQTAAATADAPSTLMSMLPLVLMFVVLYFVMIRPQMKKQKDHKAMIEALAKGDEVVVAGGLLGKVSKLSEGIVSVEIATGVEVQVQRGAVLQVLPKGTIK